MTVETAENYVLQLLPKLGVNKRRELVRLVYEIAKRDGSAPQDILPAQKNLNFESAKKQLLAKRYPVNFKTAAKDRFYLPKLELDPALRADLTPRAFYPKTVYIETSVQDSELAARVDAHLRREKRHMTASEVRFDGALAVNYSDRSVTYNGAPIQFARREFDIIEFLSQNPGLVFDRERMYDAIWGIDGEGDSSVIAEHIRRIRAKLAAAGAQKQYIETVWGVGYKWAK